MAYNKTFRILLVLLFLLPIFFIPGGIFGLAAAKATLLSIGTIIASLIFIYESWKQGSINLPWHPAIFAVVLLPIVYLLSALLSTPSSLSLFGYNFEVGTFGFILIVSLLLILTSTVVSDTYRVLNAITAILGSLFIVTVFTTVKILSGFPTWGVFFSATDNPVGGWADLSVLVGLLAALLVLAIGMFPMTKLVKNIGYCIFALALSIIAVLHFSSAFIFTLIASILLFIYFSRVEKKKNILAIALGVVSIVFLVNPTISDSRGTLGQIVSGTFGINNADIRPSFSATLSISKAVLSQGTLFGSGPNTFSRDWLIHRPADVNSTPFWGTSFSFGSGFIPTQIASTGLVGIILWLALLVLLLWVGIKSFVNLPEGRGPRFALVSTFLGIVYLWTASFLYAPSLVVLALTFAFTGLFIAAAKGTVPFRTFVFSRDAATNVMSKFFIGAATLGLIAVGYSAAAKTLSVFYFQKAIALSNTAGTSIDAVEAAINKAIRFAPADSYYTSLSKIYFSKAQLAAQATEGTEEERQAAFQSAISASIASARSAVSLNPAGYDNWISLGTVYSALVPAPLSVPGAYENAKFAYAQANNTNPSSPEPPLLLAQLEVNNGNLELARNYVRQSLILKDDYNDAYILLARIEVQDKNIAGAIASTEKLVQLNPNNPAVYLELGILKSSNADSKGAVEAFSKALELSPNYANAKYYLGLELEKLGRKAEAKSHFEDLLTTNPDSVEIKEALKRLSK